MKTLGVMAVLIVMILAGCGNDEPFDYDVLGWGQHPAISPDGKYNAWVDLGNERLVSVFKKREKIAALTQEESVKGIALSDHQEVAVASGSWVYLWTFHPKEKLLNWKEFGGNISTLTFGPNGKLLACGGTDKEGLYVHFSLYSVPDLVLVAEGNTDFCGSARQIIFSPDSTLLAIAHGNAIMLGDIRKDGFFKRYCDHPDDVLDIAFCPDGHLLATGCADKITRLWDVESGKLVKEFMEFPDNTGFDFAPVHFVNFSPDGRHLVIASFREVDVLDFKTEKIISIILVPPYCINGLQFGSNGKLTIFVDYSVR